MLSFIPKMKYGFIIVLALIIGISFYFDSIHDQSVLMYGNQDTYIPIPPIFNISPDGKKIAWERKISPVKKTVEVLTINKEKIQKLASLSFEQCIPGVKVSEEFMVLSFSMKWDLTSRYLAVAAGYYIFLYDVKVNQILWGKKGNWTGPPILWFSPDSKTLSLMYGYKVTWSINGTKLSESEVIHLPYSVFHRDTKLDLFLLEDDNAKTLFYNVTSNKIFLNLTSPDIIQRTITISNNAKYCSYVTTQDNNYYLRVYNIQENKSTSTKLSSSPKHYVYTQISNNGEKAVIISLITEHRNSWRRVFLVFEILDLNQNKITNNYVLQEYEVMRLNDFFEYDIRGYFQWISESNLIIASHYDGLTIKSLDKISVYEAKGKTYFFLGSILLQLSFLIVVITFFILLKKKRIEEDAVVPELIISGFQTFLAFLIFEFILGFSFAWADASVTDRIFYGPLYALSQPLEVVPLLLLFYGALSDPIYKETMNKKEFNIFRFLLVGGTVLSLLSKLSAGFVTGLIMFSPILSYSEALLTLSVSFYWVGIGLVMLGVRKMVNFDYNYVKNRFIDEIDNLKFDNAYFKLKQEYSKAMNYFPLSLGIYYLLGLLLLGIYEFAFFAINGYLSLLTVLFLTYLIYYSYKFKEKVLVLRTSPSNDLLLLSNDLLLL